MHNYVPFEWSGLIQRFQSAYQVHEATNWLVHSCKNAYPDELNLREGIGIPQYTED